MGIGTQHCKVFQWFKEQKSTHFSYLTQMLSVGILVLFLKEKNDPGEIQHMLGAEFRAQVGCLQLAQDTNTEYLPHICSLCQKLPASHPFQLNAVLLLRPEGPHGTKALRERAEREVCMLQRGGQESRPDRTDLSSSQGPQDK